MNLETRTSLDDATIEQLQLLTRYNIDAGNGFREAAEEVDDASLAKLFREMARDRDENASELQTFVVLNSQEPREAGSVWGQVHRGWINLRGKLNGGDPHVILIEAERGEDCIKDAYEDALKSTAGSAVNDVLMAQFRRVKAGHDRIRDLRDRNKDDS